MTKKGERLIIKKAGEKPPAFIKEVM